MEKRENSSKFIFRMVPLSETTQFSSEIKDFAITINGVAFHVPDQHIRKISKVIAQLSPSIYSFETTLPGISRDFLTLFVLALTSAKKVEMDASHLKMLAEIWINLDIDGSLKYKGEAILSLLEESLLSIATDSDTWRELFEFASALDLPRLKEKCLQILECGKFCLLRTPDGKLQIKDKDFELILDYHHRRRLEMVGKDESTKTSQDFLSPDELQLLITSQIGDVGNKARTLWKDQLIDKYITPEGKEEEQQKIRISKLEIRNNDLRKEMYLFEEQMGLMHKRLDDQDSKIKELEQKRKNKKGRRNFLKSKYIRKSCGGAFIALCIGLLYIYGAQKISEVRNDEEVAKHEFSVYRFNGVSSYQDNYLPEEMQFKTSHSIYITGIGLYTSTSYGHVLTVVLKSQSGDILSSKQIPYNSKSESIYDKVTIYKFDAPVKLHPNELYNLTFMNVENMAHIQGYFGVDSKDQAFGSDGIVRFTFLPSHRIQRRGYSFGPQFPVLFYKRKL